MKSKIITAIIFVLFVASWAHADRYCFAEAEAHYKVDRRILWAISDVESRTNNTAVNVNSDKSVDRGHMQLNSWWGFTKEELSDPCFQTLAGASILSHCFERYGSGPDAISCYNTGKPLNALSFERKEIAKEYVSKVYSRLIK